jgi:hypothetical protein
MVSAKSTFCSFLFFRGKIPQEFNMSYLKLMPVVSDTEHKNPDYAIPVRQHKNGQGLVPYGVLYGLTEIERTGMFKPQGLGHIEIDDVMVMAILPQCYGAFAHNSSFVKRLSLYPTGDHMSAGKQLTVVHLGGHQTVTITEVWLEKVEARGLVFQVKEKQISHGPAMDITDPLTQKRVQATIRFCLPEKFREEWKGVLEALKPHDPAMEVAFAPAAEAVATAEAVEA